MTKYEIDKTSRTIGLYQEDFSKLKTEADKLQQELKDSNAQICRYEEERNQFFTDIEESRKKEVPELICKLLLLGTSKTLYNFLPQINF